MPARTFFTSRKRALGSVLPGLILCLAVAGVALALEGIEAHLFGRLGWRHSSSPSCLGTAVRTAWSPGPRFVRGIAFGAKTVLEIAVVLLGASLSLGTLLAAGPGLLIGIAGVVALAIAEATASAGPSAGPAPRHPRRLRQLDLWELGDRRGAPVIGADGDDVASSIAFTAVLGVLVVLGLPLLVPLLGLSPMQYGVLAGLTVYAVPQVLAATAPVAALSVQVGTLVKLVRVLMLGPVVLALRWARAGCGERRTRPHRPRRKGSAQPRAGCRCTGWCRGSSSPS